MRPALRVTIPPPAVRVTPAPAPGKARPTKRMPAVLREYLVGQCLEVPREAPTMRAPEAP